MSDAASKSAERMPTDHPELEVLTESKDDSHGTRMAYLSGTKVPWFVIAAWGIFAIAYVVYQVIYLLPDLKAWFEVTR
jgi:hypothetical protein